MKRVYIIFTAIMMSLIFSLGSSRTAFVSEAKAKGFSLKGATYMNGVYAEDGNGNVLIVTCYDKNGEKVAFVSDMENYVFTQYEVKDASKDITGVKAAEYLEIEGYDTLTFYIVNNTLLVRTSDNIEYECQSLTEEESATIINEWF